MDFPAVHVQDLAHCSCSCWQGGCTYELDIGPENSRYADRDFLWRLSSATVDLEESVFTRLADYHRLILPLDAPLTLRHNGGKPILLAPLEVHRFDGADDTLSQGRAQDFNLMLRKGKCDGDIQVLKFPAGISREMALRRDDLRTLVFCAKGTAQVSAGQAAFALNGMEFWIADANMDGVRFHAQTDAALIVARVWKERT